jgi:protein Mpv17
MFNISQADWSFWPAVQAINFRYVSPNFRVVYVAVATYAWNTFLSYMKHKVGWITAVLCAVILIAVVQEGEVGNETSSMPPIKDTLSTAVVSASKSSLGS